MKRIAFPVMLVAIAAVLHEQRKPQPNVWIIVTGVVIFMGGMMWLSSKTPSKNQDGHGDDI